MSSAQQLKHEGLEEVDCEVQSGGEESAHSESKSEGSSTDGLRAEGQASARCGRRWSRQKKVACCCASCCGSLLVILAVLLGLLWPRDPTWEIQQLSMGPNALTDLIAVATGQRNSSGPLDFVATVSVYNPNLMGASTEPSTFIIRYGDSVLGSGIGNAVDIGGRSTVTVVANVTVQVEPSLARALASMLASSGGFILPVVVDAKAIAKVPVLRLKCTVHCDVQANVLQLTKNPEKIVNGKSCQYSYGL